MKASRLTALGLVLGAGFWIASGYLLSHEHGESRAAVRPAEAPAQKLFRVAVAEANCLPHSRSLRRGEPAVAGRTFWHGAGSGRQAGSGNAPS